MIHKAVIPGRQFAEDNCVSIGGRRGRFVPIVVISAVPHPGFVYLFHPDIIQASVSILHCISISYLLY